MIFLKKINELKGNQSFMKYFNNTSWLFLEKIVRMALGLFIGIWIARYLGVEKYGVYSYVVSFASIVIPIASLGLDSIVIRELIKANQKSDLLLGTSFILKLVGSLFSILILSIILIFISDENDLNKLIFIVAVGTIFQSFNIIDFYFQSKVLSKPVVFANIVSIIISAGIKIALIIFEAPLVSFVVVLSIENLLIALSYLFIYYKSNESIIKWKVNLSLSKTLLRESWPLILSGIAISIALRIDQVMLHEYVKSDKIGIYAVGVKVAEIFAFLPMIISQSLFPKIVKMNFLIEKNKICLIIRYVFLLLCALALFVGVTAHFWINLLYGEEFIYGYKVLQILIWTIPITYLGIMTNNLLIMQNNQNIIFIKQVSLTLLNIGLNLYLIPMYGILGAAFATLIADIIVNLFFDLLFNDSKWLFYFKMRAIFFFT